MVLKAMIDYGGALGQQKILAALEKSAEKNERHFLKTARLPKCEQLRRYAPIYHQWVYYADDWQRGRRSVKCADCKQLPKQSDYSAQELDQLQSKSKTLPSFSSLNSFFSPPTTNVLDSDAKSHRAIITTLPTFSSSSSSPPDPPPFSLSLKTSKSSRQLDELAKTDDTRTSEELNDYFNDREVLWKLMEISLGKKKKKTKQQKKQKPSSSLLTLILPPMRPSAFNHFRGTSRYAQIKSSKTSQSDEERNAAFAAWSFAKLD